MLKVKTFYSELQHVVDVFNELQTDEGADVTVPRQYADKIIKVLKKAGIPSAIINFDEGPACISIATDQKTFDERELLR